MLFDQKFRNHVVHTAAVQGLGLGAFILLLVFVLPRFISRADLGLYLTFRALLVVLYPLFSFGLDIAQARYLGYFREEAGKQRDVTASVLLLHLAASGCATIVLFLARPFLLTRFLDNQHTLFAALLTGLLLIGVQRIAYSYFQGHRQMGRANMLQGLVTVVGTLTVAVLVITGFLRSLTGILWFVALVPGVSLVPFVWILYRHGMSTTRLGTIFSYSAPRVFHVLFTGLFMSAPIILAKYYFDSALAGDVGIATRFFQGVETLAYAFNMVLLPGVSDFWARQKLDELRYAMSVYTDQVLHLALATVFAFFAAGPLVIHWFLPAAYANSIPVLQVLAAAALPYCIYAMFRSIIHGIDHRPIHLWIDLVGLLALLGSFFLLQWAYPLKPYAMLSLSFFAGAAFAGSGSLIYSLARIRFSLGTRFLLIHGAFVLLLLVLSIKLTAIWSVVLLLVEVVLAGWLILTANRRREEKEIPSRK